MHLRKGKISNRIVSGLFILLVCGFFVYSVQFNVLLRNNLEANLITQLEKDTEIVADKIDSFFTKYDEIAMQMLLNPELVDYVRNISSYEEHIANESSNYISEILTNIESSDPYIYHAWLGIKAFNGVLVGDAAYETDESYIMEERPWYQEMVQSTSIITHTRPYLNVINGAVVLSVVSPIYDEDNYIVGNVAVDLNTSDLKEVIQSYQIGEDGFTFAIGDDGLFYVMPDIGRELPSNIYECEENLADIGRSMLELENGVLEYTSIEGVDYYIAFEKINRIGWTVASVIPRAELTRQTTMLNIMSMGLLAAAAIIVFIFILNIRFSKDINVLKHLNREIKEYSNEIARKDQYIQSLAYIDPLTGLANRRKFLAYLEETLATEHYGAVAIMDLDNFKVINDTRGHIFGDRLLKRIAELLSDIEKNDHIKVCRFGGDEFLILFDNCDMNQVEEYAKSIIEQFSKKINIDENEMYIGMSMGISCYPTDSNNAEELIMFSDLAMYTVKSSGKNNFSYFDQSMTKQMVEQSKIEDTIRDCLDNHKFYLVYQPKISVETCELSGYEALIRIKDNILYPNEFIPVAESSSIIIPIGRWVAFETIQQLREWRDLGIDLKPISINFSAKQMEDKGFVEYLNDLMEEYNLEHNLIEIEITETALMENKEEALKMLDCFKEYGYELSLDDFGTGYSSLSYLTTLPVDKIKLDKSMCDRYLNDTSYNMIHNIIDISHSLAMKVVAEGIEEKEQFYLLDQMGCDYIQGYLFSKPITAEQVVESKDFDYHINIEK